MNPTVSLRSLLVMAAIAVFSLAYVGCGSSEEAMSEDEMVTDTGFSEEVPAETEEVPAEEAPAEAPAETAVPAPEPVQEQPEGPSKEQLQSEIDGLKTENIQLKDQLTSTEQNNRDLQAKISDLEAANQALKQQQAEKPAPVRPARTASAPGRSSSEEVRAYKASVAKFNAKAYADAVSEFQTLLNTGIKDDYADNCHYWIGLSYFQMKQYQNALEHLRQVGNYRFSEKKDDAQLIIAQCFERMGEKEKALTEYKKLAEQYPTSEYAGRARAKLR